MNYILLVFSPILEAAKTLMLSRFDHSSIRTDADIYKFNTLMYIGCLFVMLCTGRFKVSVFSVLLAVLFTLVTVGAQIFFFKALKHGSVALTTFMQGAGLVLPVLYGWIFVNEPVRVYHIIAIPILLAALIPVLGVKKEKLNSKWIFLSVLSMICMGAVGILQTIHQVSQHADELCGFLAISFVFAVFFNLILWKKTEAVETPTFRIGLHALFLAGISGIFMGIVNLVNLYLAGIIPKIILFPVLNGGLIIATAIGAALIFKEQLRRSQWIGIIICTAALCILGI